MFADSSESYLATQFVLLGYHALVASGQNWPCSQQPRPHRGIHRHASPLRTAFTTLYEANLYPLSRYYKKLSSSALKKLCKLQLFLVNLINHVLRESNFELCNYLQIFFGKMAHRYFHCLFNSFWANINKCTR